MTAQASGSSSSNPTNLTRAGAVIAAGLAGVGKEVAEDCLKLNVWTKPQMGEAKKAVMLWIYGGGYTSGASNLTPYSGQYIANLSDVVVVTIK